MAEKGSKIGGLGGPLLGAAAKALGKAAERPTQAGEDKARELGERLQGRAANRYRRRGGFLMQLLGGRLLPTRRAGAQLVQRGEQWNENENALSRSVVGSRHDAAYRRGGVAAAKAALVEVVGSRRHRDAEQAIIQLINTSSWVEIQGSLIPRGRHAGKRVTKTQAWQNTLSEPNNSQLWVEVARRRPDLTPDIIQAAEQAAGYTYDQLSGANVAHLDWLDNHCLTEAIGRFDAGVLPSLHQGIFQEVARLNNPALSQHLYDSLHNIANAPGDVGRNAIGSLLGPREQAINDALAPIGQSYNTI